MKVVLSPVPIACLLIGLAGAVLSNIPMVVLGVIAAIASVGFLSAQRAQRERSNDPAERLGSESRTLLRPIKRLVDEIDATVQANGDSPTVQIIGAEARAESGRLYDQVARSLAAREQLKKSLRGKYEAEKEIGEARMRLEFAGEAEKTSLNAAIEARTLELKHYEDIESHIKRLETNLSQAEAVLAEMKARLAVSASDDRIAASGDDSLRETIGRVKSLSAGYDESEQVIRGG